MLQREVMLRFALILVAVTLWAAAPEVPGYHIAAGAAEGWAPMLRSLGLPEQPLTEARVIVAPAANAGEEWIERAQSGAILILQGDTAAARKLGFVPGKTVSARSVRDAREPDLPIKWEKAATVNVFAVPREARILCHARGSGAPLVASLKVSRGAVLWVALPPGDDGYEHFPFLPQDLVDLGVKPPFESRRLWAFFDPAWRLHIDAEALAREWRASGISALHVGSWDFMETQHDMDDYLRTLITACHRHGILVYAWLELPHVSTTFWKQHPEWREKTAQLKDAHVDWRLLMNLLNPDCRRAVVSVVRDMMLRFDWDGVNLAEIYFDGIQGLRNLKEFTPMNLDLRREFRASHGFDPLELFRGHRDEKRMREFLEYRVDLIERLHREWLAELDRIRQERPGLDIAVTYVDDRFDTTMRDALGADSSRVLPLLDPYGATFIVEDPATLWGLGPKRYAEIAKRYDPLTKHPERLGVDINIVERSKAYPTAKQTGAEVLGLFHTAAHSFARVMYYYERSIAPVDSPLIPAAAAAVDRVKRRGEGLMVSSPRGVGVRWSGPAAVDGRPWPVHDRERVWLPPGEHVITPAGVAAGAAVLDFTGTIESAASTGSGIELEYTSEARAIATLDRKPVRLTLDGQDAALDLIGEVDGAWVLRLPRGRHSAIVGLEQHP